MKKLFPGVAVLLLFGAATAFAQNYAQTNMYGGPIYDGPPELGLTAALVKAGGGAEHYSTQRALVSMLGEKTVNAEVGKLQRQYGKKKVADWLSAFDFAVGNALEQATAAGVKLPQPPANLHGVKLAEALVSVGTAPDDVFWSGLMYDHVLSHKIHYQLMLNINAKYGSIYDTNLHTITNQAMYDVAQALGKKNVKLAFAH